MLKILDFYAPWCGQCRKLMPIIDEIAKEYPNIKIEKINSEDNMELAQKYNVGSLPCIILVDDNEDTVGRIDGMTTKSKIVDKIEKLI